MIVSALELSLIFIAITSFILLFSLSKTNRNLLWIKKLSLLYIFTVGAMFFISIIIEILNINIFDLELLIIFPSYIIILLMNIITFLVSNHFIKKKNCEFKSPKKIIYFFVIFPIYLILVSIAKEVYVINNYSYIFELSDKKLFSTYYNYAIVNDKFVKITLPEGILKNYNEKITFDIYCGEYFDGDIDCYTYYYYYEYDNLYDDEIYSVENKKIDSVIQANIKELFKKYGTYDEIAVAYYNPGDYMIIKLGKDGNSYLYQNNNYIAGLPKELFLVSVIER